MPELYAAGCVSSMAKASGQIGCSGRGRPLGALHYERQAAGQEHSCSPAEDGPQAQRAFGLLGAGQRATRHHIAPMERIDDDRAAHTGSRLPADYVLAMVANISEYTGGGITSRPSS